MQYMGMLGLGYIGGLRLSILGLAQVEVGQRMPAVSPYWTERELAMVVIL